MATTLKSSVLILAMSFFNIVRAQMQQMPTDQEKQNRMSVAHGILMGITFAVLFPLGAIVMRVFSFRGLVWFHAGWQAVAYAIALAGLGLGVWVAVNTQQVSDLSHEYISETNHFTQLVTSNGHAIIGIIVVGALIFQPVGGLVAHRMFKHDGRQNAAGMSHKWLGRILLILGAINGGLGLQLAANTVSGEIAYGVIAGFFFLLWFVVIAWTEFRGKQKSKDLEIEETK